MECYLCGTENAPDADFCVRCDGQLLRIASEPDPVEPDLEELYAGDEEDEEAEEAPRRKRARIIRSAEHRRLQAALGLEDQIDEVDASDKRPAPAIVPKVEAISVPHIGTRPARFDVGGVRQDGPNKIIYAMLGVLALLVGFLAFKTFTAGPIDAESPESIGFSDSTIPLAPVEETVPPSWSDTEFLSKFEPTFVTVAVFQCAGTEVAAEQLVQGVAIDENNVVFVSTTINNPSFLQIRDRGSSGIIARFNRHESGINVATTNRTITRNVRLVDEPQGAATRFVTKDFETGMGLADDISGAATIDSSSIGITVSAQGDPLSLSIGAREISLDTLEEIALYETTVNPDAPSRENPTLCEVGSDLIDASPGSAYALNLLAEESEQSTTAG